MISRTLLASAVDYGWWRTGDVAAARTAAGQALASPPVRDAGRAERRAALLGEVRVLTGGSALCPASELAILHDRLGVPLDVAAWLAGLPADEAPAELAHGRLEALPDLPEVPRTHAARLGGLAVDDPADLAHAGGCADCTSVRELLLRGRQEVESLTGAPGRPRGEPQPVGWRVPALGLGVAVCVGALAAVSVLTALVAAGMLAVIVVVALRPTWAAYLLLGVTPLIAGMDRGAVVPMLRPHEALVAVLGVGLVVHGAGRVLTGRRIRVRVTGVHVALVAMAVTSSVLPLLWLVARGEAITSDDVLHAVVLWKYLALFLLIRAAVRTEPQVGRCLWVALAASAVVALVAILQSLQWLGVHQLLATYYAPFGNEGALTNNRGTSTLASSVAVGALMSYALGIALGWLLRGSSRHRGVLLAAAVVLVLGGLASGQFSAAIALLLAVAAVGWVTGQLRRAAAAAVPATALGALLLWPVIERRLAGFSSPGGIPRSWSGRLENLRTFFWPELFTDANYVLGVRPSARVAAPEAWRDWVWIESGHTWLLWAGGVPFFLAFFAFVWAALRTVARIARARTDAIGVAAVASFASIWVMTILMTLDVHLTVRGSADLLFPLLALALTAERAARPTEGIDVADGVEAPRPGGRVAAVA